ncbi:MAG: Hsp70 family protein, partial [Spirochaetaceae bacterium]
MSGIIGIDLGTTNSAASFMEDGEAKIIPNDRGSRLTPSIVAFSEDNELLVGEAAKNQGMVNSQGTVRSVKRKMGGGEPIYCHGQRYSPQEISSFILNKIKKDSEDYLGKDIREAVISVPAYFNEKQRRATREAGRLAGFKVRRIINEPTAAALAYASTVEGNKNVLVYDLGGGTFDVTVLRSEGKRFTVLSTAGDNRLGGNDFDRILFERVNSRFSEESGMDIGEDAMLRQQLMEQVERAKIELSGRETALIALPFIGGDRKPVHLSYTLKRKELDEMIRPLIERTIELSRQAVDEAAVEIDTLIFSGGSSRIALVHTLMEEEFRVKPEGKINPDEVVALGAAVQSSLLEFEEGTVVTFQDVTPLPLGVEIDGGEFQCVVAKNSPIPSEKTQVFTTVADNQSTVEVHVLQGIGERAEDNTSLGRFLLTGIRRAKRGIPQIEVHFKVDLDGLLNVTAKDLDTGVSQDVTISREGEQEEGDLSDESLRMRIDSLVKRVKGLYLNASSDIGSSFKEEVDEIVDRSLKAADKKNRRDMLE